MKRAKKALSARLHVHVVDSSGVNGLGQSSPAIVTDAFHFQGDTN
jgi:hypothetical protein